MATTASDEGVVTVGIAALKLGCQYHQLLRLCQRGKVPHRWVGRIRLLNVADLDAVRAALVAAGYLEGSDDGR